jgi:hypothetical protein
VPLNPQRLQGERKSQIPTPAPESPQGQQQQLVTQ